MRRLAGFSASIVLAIVTSFSPADANPYLAKAGERPLHVRIATCAVSGGFAHLYTALENRLFDPYGLKLEHVFIRGSSASLAALMADEIQFLYCAADATIPATASRTIFQSRSAVSIFESASVARSIDFTTF